MSRRIWHHLNQLTARLSVNDLSPCRAGSMHWGPCPVLGVAATQRSVGTCRGFGVRQARVCALALPCGCCPSGFRETAGRDAEPGLCLATQECSSLGAGPVVSPGWVGDRRGGRQFLSC